MRGLGIARVLCVAAASCVGDADLGSERARIEAVPALQDAGDAGRISTSSADAAATPQLVDAGLAAGTAPLLLSFQVAGTSVTQVHVSCKDACIEVALAAAGGTPPYVLGWDDGSTETPRWFCPDTDTTLTAVVHDAMGRSRTSMLGVYVSGCSTGALCANNLSFEGAPTRGVAWLSAEPLSASPWDDCRMDNPDARTLPKIVASDSGDEFPEPSEGASYLYLESAPGSHHKVAQSLCSPLEPSTAYSLKVDLARAAEDNLGAPLSTVQVEVYGATTACQREELLWTSPRLGTGWRTFCLTLRPTKPATSLILSAFGPGPEASAVFIDHIVPVATCP